MRVDIAIVFVGLIVQVNQPWSLDNTAVLPFVESHTAELVIPRPALADPREVANLPIPHEEKNEHVIIQLKDVDVRVRGTRGMFNRRTREYKDAVPSLKKVGGCRKLRNTVRRREQDGPMAHASFVDLRGGRMVPHRYVPNQLSFGNTDFQKRCTACSVMYQAELRNETATLVLRMGEDQPAYELHLKKGAQILVRNIPPEPVDGHHEHAYVVFEQCGSRPIPDPTLPCRKPECTSDLFDWEGSGRPSYLSGDCIIDDA
jgi:hypothetical protein